jgi:serine/threonine protein kinase
MERGTLLKGKYRLDERLGSGGMGTVWRGEDIDLRRSVAIKVLLSQLSDEAAAERFLREARIAAGLQHPGITVVHDFGRDAGRLFIVMELLKGSDLAAILGETPGGLPVGRVLRLGIQVAEALSAAHEQGVVHRDLKPANLFVLHGDRVKICDFGIAKATDVPSTLTSAGFAIGTPAYMSPEQWTGEGVDTRSDLYSFGCVLYALLTGRPPFDADNPVALMRQHAEVQPAPPQGERPIPEPLSDLVLRLLAKSPQERPPTAASVTAELARLTPPARTPTAARQPKKPSRRDFAVTETITPGPQPVPETATAGPAPGPASSPKPSRSSKSSGAPESSVSSRSSGSPRSTAHRAPVSTPRYAGTTTDLPELIGTAARGVFWGVSRLIAVVYLSQPLIIPLAIGAASLDPWLRTLDARAAHISILPVVLMLLFYFGSWAGWSAIAGIGGFFGCMGVAFVSLLAGLLLHGHLGPVSHLGSLLLHWAISP